LKWCITYIVVVGLISILLTNNLYAQQMCLEVESSSVQIPDSIIVIPNSITINNSLASKEDFQFNNGLLILKEDNRLKRVCFDYLKKRTEFVKPVLSANLYDSTVLFKPQFINEQEHKNTQELLGLDGIEIEGAFLRSVSGGQNRGAYMHSAMDLKLTGQLSDDLYLNATLTDQQLPFEPEGNTQRLQDFDRVNIQLIHDNWTLQGGDIGIRSAKDFNFLRYDRLVQGVGISTPRLTLDSTGSSSTSVVSSISRSKVGTQTLKPIEGVLGPYRIEGPQNEPFIFLIAGSERVYLNGELLKRGLEHDYIIDYNAAEITFNASLYISKFSQILIEFEYSDQQFGRNVTALDHHQTIGNLKVRVGYFQENDNINNPLTDLSQAEMESLANAETSLGYGYIEAIDSATFVENKVLYEKNDTLINSEQITYYRYSRNKDATLYNINFSFVGEGNGNYIISSSNTNQKIYEWIAPSDGKSVGNYAPVRKIALPQQRKLLNIGASYQFKNQDELSFDYAKSEQTRNRFNPEHTQIDGNAFIIGYESGEKKIGNDNPLSIKYGISYEYLDSAFQPIQNFRALDFNREWGVNQSGQYQAGEEQLLSGNLNVTFHNNRIEYTNSLREKLGEINLNGTQQSISYAHTGDFAVQSSLYSMSSKSKVLNNDWKKAFAQITYNKWAISPGYIFDFQRHSQVKEDSIQLSFQNYYSQEAFLQKQDSGNWNFRLSHQIRSDFIPEEGKFKPFELSQTTQMKQSLRYDGSNNIELNILRRAIEQKHESADSEDFYQGSINWNAYFWQGNITQQFFYQTGSGRVLQRSYFFQEVALGLGTHSWSDLNANGEKELEEFFEDETTYGDRNYIKVFNFSNSYQTAYNNQLRYLLSLKLPNSWRKSSLLLNMLSRVSGQFQANLENKNTFDAWHDKVNPFDAIEKSESLLSSRDFVKSSVFLNRGGKLNTSFNWTKSERKQLLLNGFDQNKKDVFNWQSSLNITNDWDLLFTYHEAQNSSSSELLESRNYAYGSNGVTPKVQWQHYKNWRVTFGYEYTSKLKDNSSEEKQEGVIIQKIDLNTKWIKTTATMLEASLGFIQLNSSLEDKQSPLAYEMFEGLRAGDNVVWNVNLRKKIIGDLNLNVSYNGRKTPDNRAVQFGSVQLSALF
jgi:hypothetical protein